MHQLQDKKCWDTNTWAFSFHNDDEREVLSHASERAQWVWYWKWVPCFHNGKSQKSSAHIQSQGGHNVAAELKVQKESEAEADNLTVRGTASSYFTRAHFSGSDPSEGLNTRMITTLLLLLRQLSGRKTRLALAAAAPPTPSIRSRLECLYLECSFPLLWLLDH